MPDSEADRFTQLVSQLEYAAHLVQSRGIFLLNYPREFRLFDHLIDRLQATWIRVARERNKKGATLVGLWMHSSLFVRHAVLGFQALVSYQSFLAWLTFRPGLEALLIMGKWANDPANAKIWKEREKNRKLYRKTYEGAALASRSLPQSRELRSVLSRINDDYLHPNPVFGYRETQLRNATSETLVLETRFFDREKDEHEAHLLAYLHLLEIILTSSEALLNGMLGPPQQPTNRDESMIERERERATLLASRGPIAKKVLEELGLWSL